MQRIFDRCGRGPLIIVGTDIPFITREIIAKAFRELRRADAVFGRAEDGGYWLVGLRRRPSASPRSRMSAGPLRFALADTLKNLRAHRIAFAETLFDIDTEADYRRYLETRNFGPLCDKQPDRAPPSTSSGPQTLTCPMAGLSWFSISNSCSASS